MEEICWKQFWKTGKIEDYLVYRNDFERDRITSMESEETFESDYSDRNGAGRISF